MKNKSEVDKYVESRLIEWADWINQGCYTDIGFSNRNMLARLRDEGGILITASGTKYPPENPAAEEIEMLVRELARQLPERAEVLRIYYLHPIEPEAKARRIGYSKPHFYAHLKFAHEWIKGYLTARKKYF